MVSATAALTRPVPAPPADLHRNAKRIPWKKHSPIHRVHREKYAGDAFNSSSDGDARFSPILNAAQKVIPTIYGGTSFECAAMETVFHEIPYVAGLKTHSKKALEPHRYSVIEPQRELNLADLSSVALRRLGVKRAELIDTDPLCYPLTREWSVAFHAQCPDIDHDREHAIKKHLLDDLPTYTALLDLAAVLGVNLV